VRVALHDAEARCEAMRAEVESCTAAAAAAAAAMGGGEKEEKATFRASGASGGGGGGSGVELLEQARAHANAIIAEAEVGYDSHPYA
jgi:hypothetical protein